MELIEEKHSGAASGKIKGILGLQTFEYAYRTLYEMTIIVKFARKFARRIHRVLHVSFSASKGWRIFLH